MVDNLIGRKHDIKMDLWTLKKQFVRAQTGFI
jgi:hypothetical protein